MLQVGSSCLVEEQTSGIMLFVSTLFVDMYLDLWLTHSKSEDLLTSEAKDAVLKSCSQFHLWFNKKWVYLLV